MLEGYYKYKDNMSLEDYVKMIKSSDKTKLSSDEYQDYLEVTGMYDNKWDSTKGEYDWFTMGDGEYLEKDEVNHHFTDMFNNLANDETRDETIGEVDADIAALEGELSFDDEEDKVFDLSEKQNIGIAFLTNFKVSDDKVVVLIEDINSDAWKNIDTPEETPDWIYKLLIQIFGLDWIEVENSIFLLKKSKADILKKIAKEIKDEKDL